MKKVLFSVVVAGVLGFGMLQAAPYDIDKAHSSIDFKIGHLLVSNVNGNFSNFYGDVDIDSKTKTINKLEGGIEIASIDTRNKDRDGHLMGDKYLDNAKYPKATLKMTKFSKDKKGIKVEADVTIKDVTKKVVFTGGIKGPVQHPKTRKEMLGLELKTTINRKDFNIAKDASSATMGESIEVVINLELAGK